LAMIVGPVERASYRLFGVNREAEQDWKGYARSALMFSAASWLMLYLILRTQSVQPLNPQGFTHSGPWDLSFNTASSFVSNTSWQFYAGETTLSDFAQMGGITVASFTSMATGMAVAAAVIRGLSRRGTNQLGNFWVDLIRSLLYVVLPLAIVASILLVATGVPQTFEHHLNARGPTGLSQRIAIGPVASQEAIKLMSGDGGGFFNTNSAHPFENPNGLSNFIEIVLMLLIPAAFTVTFGQMIGRRRQGWALYVAMLVMFLGGTTIMYLLLVVLAVFIAGLMVGRTPEYLGKQIQAREVKLATIGSLFVPRLVLVSAAIAIATAAGRQSMSTGGPQGMAESAYAYLSQAQNNGSAFAGYSGFVQPVAGNVGAHGIVFADIAGGWVMMLGRFVPILAALALAGSLGPRRIAPPGLGTLRTDTPTFVIFLIGFVLIFAVLTFLTVLVLAPFAQTLSSHLLG
jgi:potassium-transporting ATPase potassium-binding subunit